VISNRSKRAEIYKEKLEDREKEYKKETENRRLKEK
jgi:hypothetical protein